MSGPITAPLTVTTASGSPSGRPITTIKVSDGDLTISGGIATIDTSGSGGTPGGSTTEVQYNNAGAFGGDAGFTVETAGGGDTTKVRLGALILHDDVITVRQTNATLSLRSDGSGEIILRSSNEAGGTFTDSVVAILSNTNADEAYLKFRSSSTTDDGGLMKDGNQDIILKSLVTNKDIDLQVNGTGQVEVQNTTTDTASVLSIMGNGTGDARLDMQNASKRVWVVCDENKKLKVQGGSGGNTFIFDASSATGGITWPDGTEQITAASGVSFPLEGSDGSAAAPTYSFSADSDTGMYRIGESIIGFTSNAARTLSITANYLRLDGPSNPQIINCDGAGNDLELRSGGGTYGKIRIGRENQDIDIQPAGTGAVEISGAYKLPTAVTGSNDYVLTAQTDGSTAWAAAGGGGATDLSGLTDVLIDATNFSDGFLIQPESGGAAPTTGTLSGAADNVGIGRDVFNALTSGSENYSYGSKAGEAITSGNKNIIIGKQTGSKLTIEHGNTMLGYRAGQWTASEYNIALGYQALQGGINKLEGDYNIGIGYNSLKGAIDAAEGNIAIGKDAGDNISDGSNNVVIGAADVDDGAADDQLVISSGDGTPFWIKGDSGGSCYQGDNASTWSTTSDERLKTNIVNSPKGLEEIKLLKVRNFNYIEKATPITEEFENEDGEIEERIIGYDGENKYNLDPEPLRTGFIAQELEVILPEAVKENLLGHKTVDIDPVIYSLINAVQELSAKVEALEAMIE